MKIGIDMLPLKTFSFTRGVGKYTFNLVKKLIFTNQGNEYYLYNVPKELFCEFENNSTNILEREPNISDSAQMDVFLLTSLMELGIDIKLVPSKMKCKTVLLFYDLIPIIFWGNYLELPQKDLETYFKRLSYIKDFDLILVISQTTKKDLAEFLEIPTEKISVIYAGLDENYLVKRSDENRISEIKKKYGISGKFLLTTPGMDFRKNIKGMFEGYSYLPSSLIKELTFVLVCKLQHNEEEFLKKKWSDLELPAKKLILTNYIPVNDLITLYDSAEIFVFPSLYEGFGLPVLEAMARGCPVVTSNISSLPEVCESAAVYVDPQNYQEIAESIKEVFENKDLSAKLKKLGLKQSKKFSWAKVAFKTQESLNFLFNEDKGKVIPRYKIAFFTPLNPIKSGISDYSEGILKYLHKFVDIDIFIDSGYTPNSDYINNSMNIYQFNSFEKMWEQYDLCIYQLGNSDYHRYMFDYIKKYPGIVVLHDLILHAFFAYSLCKEEDKFNKEKYLEYVFNNHGYKKYLNSMRSLEYDLEINPYDISMNFFKEIADSSVLTLVHNNFSKNWIENQISFVDVRKLNMAFPVNDYSSEEKRKLRSDLGFSNDVIISAFGRITFTKRIEVLLKAFSKLIKERKVSNVKLLLVGEICEDVKEVVLKIIKNENLDDRIIITGHVPGEIFNNYFQVTDICVNLRYPTSGETSATLIQALSYSIPCITTNYAQYKEYPDNCCWKIDLQDYEIDLLVDYLFELVTNQNLRQKMSQNAHEYVKYDFSIEQTSQKYLEAIDYAVKYRSSI